MTRTTLLKRAAAVVGLVAVSLGSFGMLAATTAQASPARTDQPRPALTLLLLTVTPRTGTPSSAVLTCNPAGGLHPSPAAACADLTRAGGDITKLPGDPDTVCPDVWAPAAAGLFGWWEGRLTWANQTYGNMCELYAATGRVFPVPNQYGNDDPAPGPSIPPAPGPTTIPPRPGPTIG